MDRQQEKAAVGRGSLAGSSVMLVKPQTFMNRSGQSVGALARYYKVPLERVLVVADDLDTPLGALRLRAKGSNAGHNGMRSVQSALGGSTSFPRLRLGIGRPADGRDIADFVLQVGCRDCRGAGWVAYGHSNGESARAREVARCNQPSPWASLCTLPTVTV